MTKDETTPPAAKDETPATEVTKDETPVTEIANRSNRHPRRRRLAWLVAVLTVVASIIPILTFFGIENVSDIIPSPRGDRTDVCSLSMDLLEPGTDTREKNTLGGSCLTQHYLDGEYAKYYEFRLSRATTVTVEMTSRDVNSWLALRSGGLPFGSAEALGEDDDGGDGVDARIKRFLAAGTYTIEATTRTAGLTGDFTLTVTVGETDECSVSIDPLGPRYTRNDTLDDSCQTPHYPAGEYARYYEFTLNQAATVTMEMTSQDVNSWLALRSGSPPGNSEGLEEENDDGGGGIDARIERSLAAGTYTIEATTLSVGETGDFTLTVTVGETDECSVSIDPLGPRYMGNDTLDGSCSSEHYPDGEYAKYYGFTLNQAATVTVEMTSRDVNSWLALRSGSPPGNSEALEDDGGGGIDARIERFLAAGTYTIEATTLSAGETGDFTLTVTVDETAEVR